MTQCNTLNLKLFSSQLDNKLKSGIKNGTEVILKNSSAAVGNSNDGNNFPHKFLLTNTQVLKLLKASANNSSANINPKIQLHKIGQPGGFLGRLLGPLLKTGLPLIGNVLKVACRVKAYTTWTTMSIISSHYFSKKLKTSTLQEHKKSM